MTDTQLTPGASGASGALWLYECVPSGALVGPATVAAGSLQALAETAQSLAERFHEKLIAFGIVSPSLTYLGGALAPEGVTVIAVAEHVPAKPNTDWLHDRRAELAELAELSDDWDHYGAPGPNLAAKAATETVLEIAHESGLEPNGVSASVDGGLVVYFENGHVELCNDGSAFLAMDVDGGGVDSREASQSGQELIELIRRLLPA